MKQKQRQRFVSLLPQTIHGEIAYPSRRGEIPGICYTPGVFSRLPKRETCMVDAGVLLQQTSQSCKLAVTGSQAATDVRTIDSTRPRSHSHHGHSQAEWRGREGTTVSGCAVSASHHAYALHFLMAFLQARNIFFPRTWPNDYSCHGTRKQIQSYSPLVMPVERPCNNKHKF